MENKKIISPIYLVKPSNEWFSKYDSKEKRKILGGYKDMETLLKNSDGSNYNNTKSETKDKNNNSTNKKMEEKMTELNEKKPYDITSGKYYWICSNSVNDKNTGAMNQNNTNSNNKNIEKIITAIPIALETSKVISNNNSEVRKEELNIEQNKDNNTIDFANRLLEKNADTEKVIKFVESERDEDRKCQTFNKVCDTVVTISIIALGGYFISKLFKNNNNSNN